MKKISILCSALLLTLASVGCGNSADSSAPSSDALSSESIEEKQKIENFDPFEKISVKLDKPEDSYLDFIYPSCSISLDTDDPELRDVISYKCDAEIIKATSKAVTVRLDLDASYVEDMLQKNIRVLPVGTQITLPLDDIPMYLISEDLLTEENKTELSKAAADKLHESIAHENDDISSWNSLSEEYSGGNPENQLEKKDTIDADLTLDKYFITAINPDIDFVQEEDCSVGKNYTNWADLYSSKDYELYVVFKNKDNSYCLLIAKPVFINGVIDMDKTTIEISKYSPADTLFQDTLFFPTEDDVMNQINDISKGEEIKELPIS